MCKDAIQHTFYKLYISKNNLRHVEILLPTCSNRSKHRLIDIAEKTTRRETIDHTSEPFISKVTILGTTSSTRKQTEMVKKKVTSLLSCLTVNQQEVVYLKVYDRVAAQGNCRISIYRRISQKKYSTGPWRNCGRMLNFYFFLLIAVHKN